MIDRSIDIVPIVARHGCAPVPQCFLPAGRNQTFAISRARFGRCIVLLTGDFL
jgi:hypothetical protein